MAYCLDGLRRSQRRGTVSAERGVGHHNITPVCQVASRPDSGLARTRQAEEGRVSCESPTADGLKRDSSPTASCRYSLRSSRIRTSTRETRGGPGVRPATSPAKGKAMRTGFRHDASRGDGQKVEDRGARITRATKPAGQTKKPPLQRQKRSAITNRLLNAREIQRLGTWNVRSL